MGIFQGIMDELPSFEKYWTQIFQNKSMPVVSECQSNMFPFYRLRNDLFLPKDNTKKETSVMIGEMEVTATKALLANIRDEKNATEEHMLRTGRRLCWDNTSNADHAAGLFKMSVNDTAERYFGTMTGQNQSYNKI